MGSASSGENHFDSFSELTPGTVISKYTIVEKIGAGGMGEVYLADDGQLRRQVVLKFLPVRSLDNLEFRERLDREARATAAISHPNIVAIHDIGDVKNRPYIVMEYFRGMTLREYRRKVQPSAQEIINVGLQIAEGLNAAHLAGVVHRDIKSENILLSNEGLVKILDFGLAHLDQEAGPTQTGTALGTVTYMSPEQVQGKRIDHRTDLFSLGIVLYELVSGRLPFSGDNMAAIINNIMNTEPASLDDSGIAIPLDLANIIFKLLEKKSSDRYQSAAEVATDLRLFASGCEVSIVLPARQRRKRMISASVALLIVVMATVWYLINRVKPELDDRPKLVVVLPFSNMGDIANNYFVAGITDEITIHLTKFSGLGVISRESAAQYLKAGKPHQEIFAELGADYILEGSVRWNQSDSPERIRINTILKDAKTSVSLWGESYDKQLDDIFVVQSDIARKVSLAMNVTLLDSEQRSLGGNPTDNMEAYRYYLRGLDYFNERKWSDAQRVFEHSIELDSSFASAWARLSRVHSLTYWWYLDRSEERIELARHAAEKSLQLEPDNADGHIAMGRYFYRRYLDYAKALKEYEKALKIQPNNSDLIFAIGSAKRRQGLWSEATERFRRAITLDPMSHTKIRNLAQTYQLMRQHEDALEIANRLLELFPDDDGTIALKVTILAGGLGRIDEALALLKDRSDLSSDADLIDAHIGALLLAGDFKSPSELLVRLRETDYFHNDSGYYYLQLGEVRFYAGDLHASRSYYDSSRMVLERIVNEYPDVDSFHSLLGVAYAGIGDSVKAIFEGKKAMELCPISKDALSGTSWAFNMAIIYSMLEMDDMAIAEIKSLFEIPTPLTKAYLIHHPIFSRLQNNPEIDSILSN